MPLSSTEVWKLLVDSRLVGPEQVALLQTKYNQAVGDEDATSVARWLVEGNIVSRYQAKILLSGRAGPFTYGEYRIYDRINQGRLSGAFHAIHEATQHPVMLYFLSGHVSQDPELWRQAIQRTATLTGLRHPNVQRWFQLVDLTTFKFLVGENLSGICLTDHLGENRLPVKRACGLIRQAAIGLAALHQRGWVHGDVRPWNVWSNSSGQVQLLIEPTETPVTPHFGAADPDNQLLARSDYLAPELTQPNAQLTVLTDIYALGCTFYHLLTGRAPFAGGDVAQKMGRHATEAIQPLEPFGVAADVAKLVAFMMAKNPQIRIASCDDIVQALGPFADTPQKATPPDLPSLAAFERVVQAAPTPPLPAAASAAVVVTDPVPVIHQPVGPSQPVVQAAASQPTAAPTELAAIAVKDAGPRLTTRHRSRAARKKQRRMALIVTAAGVLLLASGLWVFRERLGLLPNPSDPTDVAQDDSKDPGKRAEITNTGTPNASTDRTGELVGQFQVVEDDGRQLWLPPTAGDPIDLEYVPQGGQLFLIVRPSDLAATAEGPGILQSLGPHFEMLRNDWLAAAGVGWEQIEQLVVSLHDNADEFPRPLFVVHLAEPFDPVAIQQGWGSPSSEQHNQAALYANTDWAYWIPADAENRVFVMGHADDVRESIDLAGAAPTLRREVARLLQSSDADRHLTLVFTPGFLTTELFRDGRSFYFGSPRRLRNALQWFLDEGIKAGMWSIHLGETAYSEVRFYGQADYDHHELAAGFRDRLQALPERIESYMVRINPPEYWKVVAFRYPQMVRFLHRYCRVGVEDEQAIINVVLPAEAPQNLILGGELVLASVPGAVVEVATPTAQAPQTLAELLATKTSFAFDQTSLESALRDLAVSLGEEYPGLPFTFDIKILGPDLEAGGITRNQQVREFSQRDATVSQILTALVMKANPITTVKQPSELDQKLIWVVAADPDNPAQQIVLITTRDAAATRQYTLPEPFQPTP